VLVVEEEDDEDDVYDEMEAGLILLTVLVFVMIWVDTVVNLPSGAKNISDVVAILRDVEVVEDTHMDFVVIVDELEPKPNFKFDLKLERELELELEPELEATAAAVNFHNDSRSKPPHVVVLSPKQAMLHIAAPSGAGTPLFTIALPQ
jgi:hypothetical protein